MKASAPSKLQVFRYSFLALPLAFAGLPLYIHAPDFYTRELGINIGLIGVLLLTIRLIDAVQDPLIGYFSDKYANQRFKLMSLGCLMLLTGMTMLFIVPVMSQSAMVSWMGLSLIIATTGFSIVTININMIGGFWHHDHQQRTRIAAWREAFGLLGLLIAALLPTLLQLEWEAKTAFSILVILFAVILLSGFLLFSRFYHSLSTSHQINQLTTDKPFAFWSLLLREHRRFFLVCFFSHLAAALPAVMVMFFIRDYLAVEQFTGLFLFIYFISGVVFMPLWVKLAASVGKQQAWLMAMLLAVCTFIWAYSLHPGDVIAYAVICVLSGMALGADLALPASVLADRVSATGREAEATQFYALLAFIPKFAIALCSGVAFLILDSIGFEAGKVNTDEALTGLIVLYALVPCVIKLAAAYFLWSLYKDGGDHHETYQKDSINRSVNNA